MQPLVEPLVILGFEDDATLASELAQVLVRIGVRVEIVARKVEAAELERRTSGALLVLVAIAHPESTGSERVALVEQLLARRPREQLLMAAPQGTYSGVLLDLDRKRGVGLLDLGRKLGSSGEQTKRLRRRVAAAIVAQRPIDLPASLFRSAIAQRSLELVTEPLALAASRQLHEWTLAEPGDAGPRPSPLWTSWLAVTRGAELTRLAHHLDELRVLELLGGEPDPEPIRKASRKGEA